MSEQLVLGGVSIQCSGSRGNCCLSGPNLAVICHFRPVGLKFGGPGSPVAGNERSYFQFDPSSIAGPVFLPVFFGEKSDDLDQQVC